MAINEPNPARLGIDLGGTKIEIVVLQADGEIIYRDRTATPSGEYTATINAIKDLVTTASKTCQLSNHTPIGIGTPGAVSLKTGLMINCNSTCLNDQPLLEDLESTTQRSVRIANDANCFALSEASDGAGKHAETVFGVILGTGVGGGITFRQQLNHGVNRIGGEWGHNPLNPQRYQPELTSRSCYCGRMDCVESWLSGPALTKTYQDVSGIEATAKDIAQLVTIGDASAVRALEQYTDLLSIALSNVINILDPEIIVLGGGVSNIDEIYQQILPKLEPHVFSDLINTKIVKATHGDSSGVRGAAWLWSLGEIKQKIG